MSKFKDYGVLVVGDRKLKPVESRTLLAILIMDRPVLNDDVVALVGGHPSTANTALQHLTRLGFLTSVREEVPNPGRKLTKLRYTLTTQLQDLIEKRYGYRKPLQDSREKLYGKTCC